MSYTLKHTAEAIDYKLNLIEKNKNLLPYPYKNTFPVGLEDVGDGSILVSALSIPTLSEDILLNTCSLPAGKNYIISLSVTNFVNEASVQDHAVQLVVDIAGRDSITLTKDIAYTVLDLSSETAAATVTVYISKGTPEVNVNSLIKPQIEEVQVLEKGELQTYPTTWVPYMDKIGNYVDGRFNGTTTKIKAHAENKDNPHGVSLEQLGAASVNHGHSLEQLGAASVNHGHKVADITDFPQLETWKFTFEDGSETIKAVYAIDVG